MKTICSKRRKSMQGCVSRKTKARVTDDMNVLNGRWSHLRIVSLPFLWTEEMTVCTTSERPSYDRGSNPGRQLGLLVRLGGITIIRRGACKKTKPRRRRSGLLAPTLAHDRADHNVIYKGRRNAQGLKRERKEDGRCRNCLSSHKKSHGRTGTWV